MSKPLIPPDKTRCQAMVPTGGPFQIGGEIGDPRDGYRVRCRNVPTVIVTEVKPGPDGQRGSMSLCGDCLDVFNQQMPAGFACTIALLCDNCRKVELTAESRDPDYPLLCRNCGQRFQAVRGEVHDFIAACRKEQS